MRCRGRAAVLESESHIECPSASEYAGPIEDHFQAVSL